MARFADNFNVVATTGGRRFADNFNVVSTGSTAPSAFTASPRNAAALAGWTAATGAVTGYEILATTSGGLHRLYRVAGSVTQTGLTRLVNGLTWTLSLTASSTQGASAPVTTTVTPTAGSAALESGVNMATVVPLTAVAPVLSSVLPGNGGAIVTFVASTDDGGGDISAYRVTASSAGAIVAVTVPVGETTATLSGLINGTAYDFTVVAINSAGPSAASNTITSTPFADGIVITPPVDPGTPGTVTPVRMPQPAVEAFPVDLYFAPANFQRTSSDPAGSESFGNYREMALVETYRDPSDNLFRTRDSLRIVPSFGAIWMKGFDPGVPAIRDAVQDLPEADGTYDETRYTGARVFSLEGVVLNNAYGGVAARAGWDTYYKWESADFWLRFLSAWSAPSRRYRIYLGEQSGLSHYADVRGAGITAPTSLATRGGNRPFQMQFVCPSGKFYSLNKDNLATLDGRNQVTVQQSGSVSAGRVYPETAPYLRNYPAPAVGTNYVLYRGSVPNGFVVEVNTGTGSMTGLRITVTGPDNVSQSVGISGFTIPAGKLVTIDMVNRTITMRTPGSSLVDQLDAYMTAPLQWATLKPGVNRQATTSAARMPGYNKIDFIVSSAAADASARILYSDADLI